MTGLPEGVGLGQVLAVLLPVAAITLLLRQLPFSFIGLLRGNQFFATLGVMMPVGVMAVLVVYTVSGQAGAPGGVGAALLGVAATLGLHAWKRDSGLSIFGGTLVYMLLVNLVF